MKPLLCLALVLSSLSTVACAQDTWEQRKANQFKQPLSDQQQQEISAAIAGFKAETPKQPRKVLVFYRCEGFIHNSIPYANFALETLGKSTGAFTVDLADQYSVFNTDNLKQYDAIVLNNTTGMAFPEPAQMNAFLDFVSGGKGLVGIHAASDNFGRHPECRSVVGGEFGGHPWNAGGRWAFKLDDPKHVLNRSFAGTGFWHTDEIYQYKPETYVGPKVLRLLVSLDMNQDEVLNQIKDGPREVLCPGCARQEMAVSSTPTLATAKIRLKTR